MKRTLLAASVAVLLFAGFAEVLYAAPDLRREELLGQREVDFRADNDVIEVGRSEGRFQKIRVVVRGAPIELRDMKVIFDDDSVIDVPRRSRILRENSDFVIDLPGERRVIKRITFQYRSVNTREGKATVLVYGDHGRDIRRESRRDELLGQREVDFRADNDVIEVGRSEGRFQKIRVVVRGAPIELRDMKVIFDDDSVIDVPRRSRILRENSDFVIDLPGERRVIKRITFQYRSVNPREGKATVLVYGDHGRDIRRESRRDELLGQREVDFRADNDVIEVGRSEGRFRKLRVIVRGAPIELRDMKVIFEDNSVLDVTRRSRILRENSDFVIDLPGERRVIQRIDFQYRSVDRREGKATVLVYGRH